jgi:hypothetical protein
MPEFAALHPATQVAAIMGATIVVVAVLLYFAVLWTDRWPWERRK